MKRFKLFLIFFSVTGMSYSQLNWYQQSSGTNVVLLDICFTDYNNGWVCGNAGTILNTDDGGANWYEQDAPPDNTYYAIDFPTQSHGFACGYGGKIISTTDGGNLWEEQESNTDTYLYDVFFVDESTGWIVGGDNGVFPSYVSYRIVLHTNNGGASWTKQIDKTEESPLISVFFVGPSTGYAVSDDGDILFTDDGGINWSRQASYSSNQFSSVFFADENFGWVSGTHLGPPHRAVIIITDDGGNNWTEVFLMEGFSPADIFFFDEFHGWMTGSGGPLSLFYTYDRGYTWFPEDPGVFVPFFGIDFLDETTGWACGNQGTIISSSTAISTDFRGLTDEFKIYPNPARETFTVRKDPASIWEPDIYLLSSGGQLVYSEKSIFSESRYEKKIDVRSFPEGFYLVVLEDHTTRKTEKVLVMH